ncbi:pstA domain protein [Mycobacterium xenopi 4042]|uniref:PstA domain protein n=1 Tax=Mycobacterium xenopi 4042 TaxID=1299334 RepID=X7ZEQ9_MYCXE|nr:pstA domain protein [Mycobacterium xenopi 4042]
MGAVALLRIRRFGGGDFGALLHGGRLVVVPEEVVGSPEDFRALLVGENVTVLTQTRPRRRCSRRRPGVRGAADGGEPCRWSWCSVGAGRVMINAYAPPKPPYVLPGLRH